jgi:hypothetical protein
VSSVQQGRSSLVPRPGDFVILPMNLGAPGPALGTWETTDLRGHDTKGRTCSISLVRKQKATAVVQAEAVKEDLRKRLQICDT